MDISKRVLFILVILLIALSIFNTLSILQHRKDPVTAYVTAKAQVSLMILSPVGIPAPDNFTITLLDDRLTTNLNWTSVSGAYGYHIYYGDSLNALKSINTSNLDPSITTVNVTSLGWTDSTASAVKKRYYRVASYVGDFQNLSQDVMGKYDIGVDASTFTYGDVEFNTISIPLIPFNAQFKNIITSASDFDFINWYNPNNSPPSLDFAYYYGGEWYGAISEFEEGKGYIFGPTAAGYNFTVVGKVPEGSQSYDVRRATFTYGDVEFNTIGWSTPLSQCNLASIVPPSTDFDFINWYNPKSSPPSLDYVYYYAGEWYGSFNCFEPGKGYIFGPIETGYNFTYNKSAGIG